jgi:general secretion pathway protein D/MSHA biogenesis protein MshL
MNVSWASDVDQYVMTDVDIRAEDDFFQAVDNLLRQVDYFHEMQGNTIVIKYKETMDFHIAMPPRLSTISSSSNVGDAAVTSLSADTSTNRWDEVRHNLDQILEIWEEPATSGAPPVPAAASEEGETEVAAPPAPTAAIRRSAKGYYSINELIGLVTVTAPRPLLAKIADYIDSLKEELYRQVAIEAKIIEVTLEESSTTGLDWRKVLDAFNIDFELFGGTGQIHPRVGEMAISQITIPGTINAVLDAIAEQGDLRVLSNPKISVMNGQPAIIYVGDNLTYIDTVTSTVAGDSGNVSTSVTTAQVTSGIRLEVYPTIISDDEIIMSLTPMVSGLTSENIPYETFGENSENKVGVPVVKEQTMNTIIRVKNGELLVVGGLIDRKNKVDEYKVRGLGDLPVINRLFKATAKEFDTTEIVILLQPRII